MICTQWWWEPHAHSGWISICSLLLKEHKHETWISQRNMPQLCTSKFETCQTKNGNSHVEVNLEEERGQKCPKCWGAWGGHRGWGSGVYPEWEWEEACKPTWAPWPRGSEGGPPSGGKKIQTTWEETRSSNPWQVEKGCPLELGSKMT